MGSKQLQRMDTQSVPSLGQYWCKLSLPLSHLLQVLLHPGTQRLSILGHIGQEASDRSCP
jgi:hypothetical protein